MTTGMSRFASFPAGTPLVVHRQQVVEDLLRAVERPPEVADPPRLAFAQQEVQHAVVDEAFVEGLDALPAADRMQQVVVDMVDLQLAERLPVHGQRILTRGIREVGHLRGDEIAVARVAFEGDSGGALREPLQVDGRRVEVVDAVRNGIIHQRVDRLLVDGVSVGSGLRQLRPAHAAVAQQRNTVARRGTRAEGHPVGRDLTEGDGSRASVPGAAAVERCGGGSRADPEGFQECAAIYLFLLHVPGFFRVFCGVRALRRRWR